MPATMPWASCVAHYIYSLCTQNFNHHEDRIQYIEYCTEEQVVIIV